MKHLMLKLEVNNVIFNTFLSNLELRFLAMFSGRQPAVVERWR